MIEILHLLYQLFSKSKQFSAKFSTINKVIMEEHLLLSKVNVQHFYGNIINLVMLIRKYS